jgi:hypothetical protein
LKGDGKNIRLFLTAGGDFDLIGVKTTGIRPVGIATVDP